MPHGQCWSCAATLSHSLIIGCLSRQKWSGQHRYCLLKMNLNGVSTTFCYASWTMLELCSDVQLSSDHWLRFWAKMVATTSPLYAKNVRKQPINEFWPCILENPRAVRQQWHLIDLKAIFLGKNPFNDSITMLQKWLPMEDWWFQAFHLGLSRGSVTTMIHDRITGRISRQIFLQQHCNHVPKLASQVRQWFLCWHFA